MQTRLAGMPLLIVVALTVEASWSEELRRQVDCDEIVFAQRVSGRDHWYGNFGHYCDDSHYTDLALLKRDGKRFAFGEGARLRRLNLHT